MILVYVRLLSIITLQCFAVFTMTSLKRDGDVIEFSKVEKQTNFNYSKWLNNTYCISSCDIEYEF